jgi:16S rRNA (guanine1516-N2)-methyltransferase
MVEQRVLAPAAQTLAERFGLQVLRREPQAGFCLCLTTEGLELRQAGTNAPGPIRVEFVAGAMGHRLRFGGGRGQPLARAVGIKSGFNPVIWDATAGLGRDGFVLASLGCRVTLCERSPVLAALLADGLQRAELHAQIGTWVSQRLTLVHADASDRLAQLDEAQRPDVVYLDPMYPAGKSHVLVKKEMRALQQILGADRDSHRLLDVALGCARRRVVVKRPSRAGWLTEREPTTCVASRKTRYDVYVTL